MGNCLDKNNRQVLDRHSRPTLIVDTKSFYKLSLEDFKIKALIGTGSTSRVFLAQKISNGRHYAIKIIDKQTSSKVEAEHLKAERKLLEKLNHPFLIKFYHAFQTGRKLHLILEFAKGGDLFTYLMKCKTIPEDNWRFYAAEILVVLEYLHSNGVIFRGLKPEDVLLDSNGHIKLSDLGLAKSTESNTSTFCGSPIYLAPEIIKGEKQTEAVDWWSFGVLLYEMMWGKPPFWDEDGKKLLKRIVAKDYTIEKSISKEAKDIISKLLNPFPQRRLGCGNSGISEIKNHKFFEGINWRDVASKKLIPPYAPLNRSDDDLGNIDTIFTEEMVQQYQSIMYNSVGTSSIYEGYTYVGQPSPYQKDVDTADFEYTWVDTTDVST